MVSFSIMMWFFGFLSKLVLKNLNMSWKYSLSRTRPFVRYPTTLYLDHAYFRTFLNADVLLDLLLEDIFLPDFNLKHPHPDQHCYSTSYFNVIDSIVQLHCPIHHFGC